MRILLSIVLIIYGLNLYSQERYVEIEGQKFRIKDFGKGNVTVIFENGMSDSIEVWGSIPDSIAKIALPGA